MSRAFGSGAWKCSSRKAIRSCRVTAAHPRPGGACTGNGARASRAPGAGGRGSCGCTPSPCRLAAAARTRLVADSMDSAWRVMPRLREGRYDRFPFPRALAPTEVVCRGRARPSDASLNAGVAGTVVHRRRRLRIAHRRDDQTTPADESYYGAPGAVQVPRKFWLRRASTPLGGGELAGKGPRLTPGGGDALPPPGPLPLRTTRGAPGQVKRTTGLEPATPGLGSQCSTD
jgi:hypothetical protein